MADRGKKPIPKTQREISISQQDPYVNPETGNTRGNPNDISTFNRGNQTSFRDDNVKPFSLGFKEIDEAIFYYMENVIKPTIIQNGVVQKVPIIYGSPERWKQIQKDGYYRDRNGKIMMPIIVFKRNNIEKNRTVYNKLDANYPNNFQVFEKSYSKVNTYDNFNILNNRIPTKQYYAVIVPDYVTITYDFVISTYYVEQLNKLIEAINYASDSYWGNPERFKFRARIDSFATPVEVAQGGERTVKSTFSLKLYGYIVPDNIQKELSAIKKFNNKNQLVFKTEIVDNLLEDVSSDTSRTKITQSPIISSGTNVINNTNVCDNAEVTVNSDSPPLSVASGGSVNLTNVNSAGTQIGTRSGTVITNPDSAIDYPDATTQALVIVPGSTVTIPPHWTVQLTGTVASPFTVVSPAWDSSFVCATQTLTGGTISSITINGGASIATFVGAIIPASATIVVTFASSLTQIVLTF
jgi:hypothetical protein